MFCSMSIFTLSILFIFMFAIRAKITILHFWKLNLNTFRNCTIREVGSLQNRGKIRTLLKQESNENIYTKINYFTP